MPVPDEQRRNEEHMLLTEKIYCHLEKIYSGEKLEQAVKGFKDLLKGYQNQTFKKREPFSEKTVYLITYGDGFQENGKSPLQTLKEVADNTLKESFTDIHLLPMFPYTSDDGFSVTDYLSVNPDLGNWEDINSLAQGYRLMFDFVANHMSKESIWFNKFLNEEEGYQDAFIRQSPDFDSKNVIRPRVSPLFHEFKNKAGESLMVWTTFSEDQVDTNLKDPEMLLRLTDVLLQYAIKGASSIRLDAIGFMWKESGTGCMHLPQVHEIIKLWHTILEELAPGTRLITETNVPHKDNISYFGNGSDEAHMVYQFPLPPLVLHAFSKQNGRFLTKWASGITPVSKDATYFNFLASHDGIGMRPVEGILAAEDMEYLAKKVLDNGGRISFKENPDGSRSVYELNINYSDALRNDGESDETAIKKMIAAHHILLSFIGVPAIYYHSVFGSRNDLKGYMDSGINRRINREKLEKEKLIKELKEDDYRRKIYSGITGLIKIRRQHLAFHPAAAQTVLTISDPIFALKRVSCDKKEEIISFTNLSGEVQIVEDIKGFDLISGQNVDGRLTLMPYGVAWIDGSERP